MNTDVFMLYSFPALLTPGCLLARELRLEPRHGDALWTRRDSAHRSGLLLRADLDLQKRWQRPLVTVAETDRAGPTRAQGRPVGGASESPTIDRQIERLTDGAGTRDRSIPLQVELEADLLALPIVHEGERGLGEAHGTSQIALATKRPRRPTVLREDQGSTLRGRRYALFERKPRGRHDQVPAIQTLGDRDDQVGLHDGEGDVTLRNLGHDRDGLVALAIGSTGHRGRCEQTDRQDGNHRKTEIHEKTLWVK